MNEPNGAVAQIAGLKVAIFMPDAPHGTLTYLLSPAGDAAEVWRALAQPAGTLVSVEVPNWNRDLSPWPAPKVFKGGEAFAGEADGFLDRLVNEVVPAVEAGVGARPSLRCVAGVSLAGLFAVYALYRTACFQAAASVSGSFWFDGFTRYMQTHRPATEVRRAYFSLGKRESETKNVALSSVEARTREAVKTLRALGVETTLEMNEGGHFVDGAERVTKAIDWLGRA